MDQTAIVDVTAIPAGDGMTVTADAAKAMIAAEKRNGLVLRGFVKGAVGDSDHHVLQGWAKEVCNALQRHDECFKMSVYEGVGCKAAEGFAAQLRRELRDKFRRLTGLGVAEDKMNGGLETLAKAIERMTALHAAALPYDEQTLPDMRFRAKIEVNFDGACVKFHDDMVDVRLVTTLVGDGTVIADNTGVDWRYYFKCGGFLPDDAQVGRKRKNFSDVIREWNGRVVASGEIACTPGDVGLMKGGKMTDRPCLHRAPYSADEGSELPRFLLTVERLESDTVQQFIEMEEDCSDSGGESEDEDEDEEMDEGDVATRTRSQCNRA